MSIARAVEGPESIRRDEKPPKLVKPPTVSAPVKTSPKIKKIKIKRKAMKLEAKSANRRKGRILPVDWEKKQRKSSKISEEDERAVSKLVEGFDGFQKA